MYVYRRVCGHVSEHVYELCVDRCAETWIRMCIDVYVDVRADLCLDISAGMHVHMCMDMRGDTLTDLCLDMCRRVCRHAYIPVFRPLVRNGHTYVHEHVRVRMYRHAYGQMCGRAGRHVSRPLICGYPSRLGFVLRQRFT